ncbi:hypothetical protein WMF11_16960 [Sorangium sp. So ce295]|uniref:hypothetical protein n=1 Tax=Sorangium sp. So ce295 TaxID=3133295 RepID=UPI003F5F2861
MLAPNDHPPSFSSAPPRVHVACVGVLVGPCVVLAVLAGREVAVPWFVMEAGLLVALLCVAAAARSAALRVSLPLFVFPLAYLFFRMTREGMTCPDIPPSWYAWREWLPMIGRVFGLLSAVAGAFGAVFFAAMASTMVRVPPRALHAVSVAVLALTTGLLAVSTAHAVREPDPEDHIASLPTIGVVPPVEGEPSMIDEGPSDPSGPPVVTRIHDVSIGRLGVRRLCPSLSERCFLDVEEAGRPFDAHLVTWLSQRGTYTMVAPEACRQQPGWINPRDSFVIRQASPLVREASLFAKDRELGELLMLDGAIYDAHRGGEAGPVVLAAPRFFAMPASMRLVAGVLGAHRRAIAVAACGALLSLALLRHRWRARRALAQIAGARAAVLAENGWLDFADGSPPVRAADRGLPPGPVVVLGPTSAGTYRGGALSGAEIVAGEQARLLERGSARIAQLDVLVFFVAVLAPLPLLTVAVTLGLW